MHHTRFRAHLRQSEIYLSSSFEVEDWVGFYQAILNAWHEMRSCRIPTKPRRFKHTTLFDASFLLLFFKKVIRTGLSVLWLASITIYGTTLFAKAGIMCGSDLGTSGGRNGA